jgi:hypothetical protein
VTFIEVHINEDQHVLETLIRDAYTSIYQETLPSFRFGRVIVWQGRLFQQLEIALEYEDSLLRAWTLPRDRARIQVGSVRGEVFTTPPEAEGEPAARIKEGGRCGQEYTVKPFHYSAYDDED